MRPLTARRPLASCECMCGHPLDSHDHRRVAPVPCVRCGCRTYKPRRRRGLNFPMTNERIGELYGYSR